MRRNALWLFSLISKKPNQVKNCSWQDPLEIYNSDCLSGKFSDLSFLLYGLGCNNIFTYDISPNGRKASLSVCVSISGLRSPTNM